MLALVIYVNNIYSGFNLIDFKYNTLGMAGNMGARQGVAVVGGGEQQIEEAVVFVL